MASLANAMGSMGAAISDGMSRPEVCPASPPYYWSPLVPCLPLPLSCEFGSSLSLSLVLFLPFLTDEWKFGACHVSVHIHARMSQRRREGEEERRREGGREGGNN